MFQGQKASPQMIAFSIYYILAVIEFVLLLFADKRADGYVKEKVSFVNGCPHWTILSLIYDPFFRMLAPETKRHSQTV